MCRARRTPPAPPTLLTNCSNNYGPYHFPEKLIPHMIIKGLAEEPLPVYGDGLNVRNWLYVEDHRQTAGPGGRSANTKWWRSSRSAATGRSRSDWGHERYAGQHCRTAPCFPPAVSYDVSHATLA
jgi:hypothetical protein